MGLSPTTRVNEAVDAWLHQLSATKPPATVAAYRRDIEGVGSRIAASALRVEDLSKQALQLGFASWANDHAPASVLRAHSAWSGFFDFLVAEDVRDGNPMVVVSRPRKPRTEPRSIRHPEAAARLLATAAVADPQARAPWPERDLALIATFCVTGIRSGEAVSLDLGSLTGPPGDRQLVVVGKSGNARAIPMHEPLEAALAAYLQSRAARFPGHDLDDPSTALFVNCRGEGLSADQMKYLVERLYVRAELRARVPAGALVHALRHTFAISALDAGANIVELQALLGHASPETTRRYLDTTTADLRDVTSDHPGQVALREILGSPSPDSSPGAGRA
ncbi:MAG: tyrosine-type recombinase/integrase [Actinomycetota bacterium]|nr:tyrosine-type recombinase/integrase [Actinomycetota bacterium]